MRSLSRRWTLIGATCLAALALASAASGTAERAAWWLLQDEQPVIEASTPGGPVRGPLEVPFAVRPPGRTVLLAATVDGQAVLPAAQAPSTWRWLLTGSGRTAEASPPPDRLSLDSARLPDGRHTVRLEVQDTSRRHNRQVLELAFVSDNTPPTLTLAAEAPRLPAGRVLVLHAGADEPADVRGTWGDQPLPLLPEGSAGSRPAGGGPAFLSLVAVPVDSAAGEVRVTLGGRDVAGNTAQTSSTLSIDPQTLPRQALEVPPSLAALATGPVASAEAAQLEQMTRTVRADRLWSGPFRPPLVGPAPRTTGFGDRRDYADGYVAFHAGYDLAAPQGAPVLASASGSVIYAGTLPQRGNVVVIDHGWGVATVYAHLSQIQVAADQLVAQGQQIGAVGTTGLSTGPHLHWEVRLRGLPVDPNAWLATSAQL